MSTTLFVVDENGKSVCKDLLTIEVDANPGDANFEEAVKKAIESFLDDDGGRNGDEECTASDMEFSYTNEWTNEDGVYKVDAVYDKASDAGVRFDDPTLAIAWPLPIDACVLSEKDLELPFL